MTLTPRANRALALADTQVRAMGHSWLGSQHLISGLHSLGNGVQFGILSAIGITSDSLMRALTSLGPLLESTRSLPPFVLGISAWRALERAERGATALSHTYVGTEHLLMALLSEVDGGAARIFAAHGIDTVAARRRTIKECGWSIPLAANEGT